MLPEDSDAAAEAEALLTFSKVDFAYPGRPLFRQLSFTLPEEVKLCALPGPDGAGKSTLLRLCAGLELPHRGQIRLTGGTISYMSQGLGLYLELSVWENLSISAQLRGVSLQEPGQRQRLQELLRRCDLLRFADRAAGALSGGMKQKLALCIALAPGPDLLLLDEPTVGVDPLSRRELWQLILSYLQERKARCLFSTAYLEEAERCDTLLMLGAEGQLTVTTPAQCLTAMQGRTFVLQRERGQGHGQAQAQAHGQAQAQAQAQEQRHDQGQAQEKGKEKSGNAAALEDEPGRLKKKLQLSLQEGLGGLLQDVSPRDGGIFLTTAQIWEPDALKNALMEQGLLPGGAGGGENLISLKARRPRLEDFCIAQSRRGRDSLKALQGPGFALQAEPVRTEKLERRFGAFTAVNQVSFTVRRAEIFGLLGPNGAGKTTTFRMLCALLRPSGGQIFINGLALKKQKSAARAQIGYVSQKFSLYGRLSVRDNLLYFGRSYGLQGADLKRRIAELTADFELQGVMEQEAAAISFGQQRSLSMCCALLHRPAILFLDEATSGADPAARRIFWRRINALALAGTTVIVTTHFMEEAEYCDRFLLQDQGHMLFCGSPEEFCAGRQGEDLIEQGFVELVRHSRQAAGGGEAG